jgi:4a-hydroxytetrahydrobiopterin dehydratase
MTETLVNKAGTPCRGGIPPLTREQADSFHKQAPDWQLLDEGHRIERSFRFRNFREALTFVGHDALLRRGVTRRVTA